jgi:uncharacterized protein with NRDE domain
MCVLAFAWRMDADWPLVLAGNRDERHDRPSAPLQRWADDPQVLAGRDLSAGGTWLGVSERGLMATVTNVRAEGGPEPGRPSRGWLLRDILLGEGEYAPPAVEQLGAFNPLNLLVFTSDEAQFWSNRPAPELRRLPPGLYGLSNWGFDHPEWRTDRLKAGLAAWLDDGSGEPERLADLLADTTRGASAEDLPVFLRNAAWGTRCGTVVRVSAHGHGEILERRFDREGRAAGETRLPFAWPAPDGSRPDIATSGARIGP